MAVMADQQRMPTQDDPLLEGFLAMETPEGFKAELIEGEIIVSPPPVGNHESDFSALVRQVLRKSVTDMDVSGHKGLSLPRLNIHSRNLVIPDATFAPHEARAFRDAPSWMDPDDVAMVAEVTSSRPERDRIDKRRCYAAAGIPLYLIIDRDESAVILHSEPSGTDYGLIQSFAFGRSVPLPKPFDFELDTTEFL